MTELNKGDKINDLTITSDVYRDYNNKRIVDCLCVCGSICTKTVYRVASGRTKSCGHLRRKATNVTHNKTNTILYKLYCGIIYRCENPNNKSYARYGGRGIKMCDEWRGDFMLFNNWCESNGYKRGLQIDRIDNDKGYSPNNCRFVTQKINMRNTSVNVLYDGKTILEWLEEINPNYTELEYSRFRGRLRQGWTIEKATKFYHDNMNCVSDETISIIKNGILKKETLKVIAEKAGLSIARICQIKKERNLVNTKTIVR